ncbi:4-aminobutyrate--2-oxoglutarate transaminase [Spelaeicoccus albus]|uniref:(S)-3-amino-2-methylpropionate transaminase n=1 Tax=Spelaeicoccus albus TaxID=1280376 RepID=A0A7Z0A7U2_9MICO|nr:4-aminobutyrate--2-oxoglutarate transaminase [Spelaeicoccus albus]NYI66029.1 4-aminobutyrate aminotransferase/(S)-3-amino-2-methylpropionate transaminase [Spelaeicoccus albus]
MTTVESGGPGLAQERRVVTSIPGPRSQELHARKAAAVANGVSQTLPIYITAAGGGILRDIDGNQLIDFGAGIAVVNAGNANPDVVSRVQEQVAAFTHTCFMVTPYEGYVEVAEALNRLTPGDHPKKSALFNSGAEAVENAVKIARRSTGRDAVVVFDHAYHGRTNLTMAMTAKNMPYKKGFGPFASEVYRAPMSYPLRDNEAAGTKLSGEDAAKRAISQIEKQVGADSLAAIVIEPIQGEGGFIVPAKGFLPALQAWCNDNDVVFVADEVQTGFARTGQMFACEDEGVVPDIITTAKGIAGGLPLSAVTGRAEIMDAVHGGGLGGTYGGNPVACAAALGAIETFERDDLPAKAAHIGEIMLGELTTIRAQHSAIADIRGRGAMIAIEITKPGTLEPDPELTAAVAAEAHANGLVVLVTGTYSNILRFLPPLVISEELLREGLGVLSDAFDAVDK